MFEYESDGYWKTVVDTIQDGVMIVSTTGLIVSINTAFETITGYTREEILGNPCTILNCNTCETAGKNRRKPWCSLFKDGQLKMLQCKLVRKDGGVIHVSKNASLLYDKLGSVLGAVETLTDITELIETGTQLEKIRRELRQENNFHGIIGHAASMQRVFDLIGNIAQSGAPVLIMGESGTGKELIAKAIHETGPRREQPFIKVNCAALNESLLESELFGHVKGAFTGAYKNRKGRFEAANGGDIFLDEIGDLPVSTQVKLLRVLEEKVIEQVGDHKSIPIDVRIITATNQNLKTLIEQGKFREDLYYRINMIPIPIPPLRERKEDIPLLAEFFLKRIRVKNEKEIKGISDETMASLMKYSWPGNVRELKGAFEYAFVACQDDIIQPCHLVPDICREATLYPDCPQKIYDRDDGKKRELVEVLKQTHGNQSEAARVLGVTRATVHNRIKKYKINLARHVGV
ncbi:MAG: sigma 54-interacting transcriptional regulator [Pseudomonadota bacterium]